MVGLRDGEKTSSLNTGVRQTYGRTDGQTDILPWHSLRYAYVSRGKNLHLLSHFIC